MQTIKFAQPISMPRFISIIFYQNSPKIKLFLKKNAKLSSAGGGAPPPDPPKTTPQLRISGYAPVNFALFVIIWGGGGVAFVLNNFFLIVQLQIL